MFAVWVDPRAALITDGARRGALPERLVSVTAVHLAFTNVLGAGLAFFLFRPAVALIERATLFLSDHGETLVSSTLSFVVLNLVFAFLASSVYASRVSAVSTANVATAVAIYNLFFLVTRLSGQLYAPMLGTVSDMAGKGALSIPELTLMFRYVLAGAAGGALLGWLLMPSFIELFNWGIRTSEQRGSVPLMLLQALHRIPGVRSCAVFVALRSWE